MVLDAIRTFVSRRPAWIATIWLAAAVGIGCFSPNLTRLAAEAQASMLPSNAESLRAVAIVKESWPDQAYDSMAVAVLHRPGGLTKTDRQYARVVAAISGVGRPAAIAEVLGPDSAREIAERLVSPDKTVELVAVTLSSAFVAPAAHEVVDWMEHQARKTDLAAPAGLEIRWTGDAVIGRDYMANVQTSLDRAAVATVVLLLIVLVAVYRSIWLALVPLATIGASLIISRGVLAWMMLAGWELSPLVELFLIAILFGTGTDFCLFLSWRYRGASEPEQSSRLDAGDAGSVVLGAGHERGHDHHRAVADGHHEIQAVFEHGPERRPEPGGRPGRHTDAHAGASGDAGSDTSSSIRRLGRHLARVLGPARPRGHGAAAAKLAFTVLAMVPLSIVGLRTHFIQDLLSELPESTASP